MGFLLPLAFLFALSIPGLLLLYLLKVKRKPKTISSTFLWQATVEDARASVPFQKLRRNLLMLLQMLILALLTLALARPILNLAISQEESLLVLIDTSASMAMRSEPDGETRFEEAQRKANRLVATLTKNSQVLLLTYADRAAVEVPFTVDRAKIRGGVNELTVQAAEANLKSALWLASSLVGSAPNPRLVIFSDHAELEDDELTIIGSVPAVVEACGTPTTNFGWTALDFNRRTPTSKQYDLFGQIISYGSEKQTATLEVRAGKDLLEVRNIELMPGTETPTIVENLDISENPLIHCSLRVEENGFDALELDNDAWLQIRPSKKIRLLLCSEGNYFLSRALGSIETLEVVGVAPGAKPPAGSYDIAIYDGALPARRPSAPALWIGISPWTTESEAGEAEAEEVTVGEITNWDADHPVTSLIQWSTVSVFGMPDFSAPEGTRVLVESGDLPVLTLGRSEGQVALHLGFDLMRSNFALRAAFPIFIKNSVDWLTRDRTGREIESLGGGETFTMRVDEGVDRVTVRSPSGKRTTLEPSPDQKITFSDTYECGVWQVEMGGSTIKRFGVTLMSAEESNPYVVQSVRFDASGGELAAGLGEELKTNREIWRWIAAAAFLILILEWILYRRVQLA